MHKDVWVLDIRIKFKNEIDRWNNFASHLLLCYHGHNNPCPCSHFHYDNLPIYVKHSQHTSE